MTDTTDTTIEPTVLSGWPGEKVDDDTIRVLPEITIPAAVRDKAMRVCAIVATMKPKLDELYALAVEVRDVYDAAMLRIVPLSGHSDGVHELIADATGWEDAWSACHAHIGERFYEGLEVSGLAEDEMKRGERNFPRGTRATVNDPDGRPMVAIVDWCPCGATQGQYKVVDAEDTTRQFLCSHDEIKAGLIEAETQ